MISGPVDKPVISKLYVPSSVSLLVIVKVAVRVPWAVGLKVTWNVVDPAAAIELDGIAVIVNSAAFVPETTT